MKLSEIHMRDPFILRDDASKKYYLYGTTNAYDGKGFFAYQSDDLMKWEGPFQVFKPDNNFWGTKDYWAPEVYRYHENYYMIATFKGENHHRCCQILKSDTPLGPFVIHSKEVTPLDWESLDGTLYIENGKPYLIFVHEWTQIDDGEICYIALSDDLKMTIGEPHTLFKASESNWSTQPNWINKKIHVADGPFIVNEKRKPFILWSSYNNECYDIGFSYSKDGILVPEYQHSPRSLPIDDAGHGMVFTDFNMKEYLVLHADNGSMGKEHPILVPIKIKDFDIELLEV